MNNCCGKPFFPPEILKRMQTRQEQNKLLMQLSEVGQEKQPDIELAFQSE